jgi:hypothetical protein
MQAQFDKFRYRNKLPVLLFEASDPNWSITCLMGFKSRTPFAFHEASFGDVLPRSLPGKNAG